MIFIDDPVHLGNNQIVSMAHVELIKDNTFYQTMRKLGLTKPAYEKLYGIIIGGRENGWPYQN